ncbi:Planctomycete cytochrome C [Pirellulimonas nuda]|uniref:Planctomycete cytochrome C n=1 Tax=Pirellulimonas nuda TaxID=2528009 RepID=A0A518DFM8_9BACT|nr:Planctomycete cytochrome C [Pirellulimonas nuda]
MLFVNQNDETTPAGWGRGWRTAGWLAMFALLCVSAGAEGVAFDAQVRPILSDKCYFCHGPDSETREAGLRLDLAEGAHDAIASGEVARRIASDDPAERMPPPQSKLELTQEEKTLLQSWIAEGAPYEEHWAFRPLPPTVAVQASNGDAWPKQTLDRFVRDSLKRRGLSPSAEASPERWLRRVTLDLTGLPPEPDVIDRFEAELADAEDKESVYAAVVDRLLASPGFGEQMAVAWLGAARYADSYGYQSDKLNTQWPYRDWVVRALNNNLPYDQFLTWQLAGDLLENPTREQRLATAFNRLHRLNNEGGAVFEEWRLENVADRVQTFGVAVLGLTLECARCHDHKFDPISTRDYYSISAFFNSIDESGVYDRTEKTPAPSLLLPTKSQEEALNAAANRLAEAEAAYEKAVGEAAERFDAWSAGVDANALTPPGLVLALSFDRPLTKQMKEVCYFSELDGNQAGPLAQVACDDSPLPHLRAQDSADGSIAVASNQNADDARRAIVLDGERGVSTVGVAPFDRWTPFSVVVSLREKQRSAQRSVIAHHTRGTDCGYNGWDLTIADGRLESRLYRVWPGNAIGVRAKRAIPVDQWHQVSATYDGSSTARGLRLFLNGEPLETQVLRDYVQKSANVLVDHGGRFVVGQRFRDRGFAGALIDDVRVYDRDLTAGELLLLAGRGPIVPSPDYYCKGVDAAAIEASERLAEARRALVMAEEAMVEIPVMEEMQTARETHVLQRGAYDAPTSDETRVTRDTFEQLAPLYPEGLRRDRLGLAEWATAPDHPLTSRVAVNRLWAGFFGAGLVTTPDNFGRQGEAPTHPELLDWLARDFVESGWNVKRFCRNVALSAAYRQDSKVPAELAMADPENRWLARGPAYRLGAEQIRDLALAVSGRLNREMGGPPVSPYQPGGDLWRESNVMSPSYVQSVGKELYRRSLYSVWKRTSPLPNMMAFDAETREVCSVKRSRTNTPLQALVLMNDTQFVEAARLLAERALAREGAPSQQVAWAFRSLTGRRSDPKEASVLTGLYQEELAYYRSNPEDAARLLAIGESEAPPASEPAELAAMTMACRAMLNLDAAVWKR